LTVAFFSTAKREGDARAPGALVRLLKRRGSPAAAATAEQVHVSRVAIVPRLQKPKKYPGVDGLLTDQPNQPLAVFTADCVPLFLTALDENVVGLLHAGWRGVRGNILAHAVQRMRRSWQVAPSGIRVWAGPSIGPCCFEVQWDVARHFPSTRRRSGDGWTVHLVGELRRQAKQLGIRWTSKNPSPGCTMHDERYFSYRRDKTGKRQVSVIFKREK
jgi:YfiH family protein